MSDASTVDAVSPPTPPRTPTAQQSWSQPRSAAPLASRGGTTSTFLSNLSDTTPPDGVTSDNRHFILAFSLHLYSIYCMVRGVCLPTWFVRFEPFPNSTVAAAAAAAAGGSLGTGWRRNEDGSMPVTWMADAATSTVIPYRDRGAIELTFLLLGLICAMGVLGVYLLRFSEVMHPSKRWSALGIVLSLGQVFLVQTALILFFHKDDTPHLDAGHGYLAAGFSTALEVASLIAIAFDGIRNKFRNDLLRSGEQTFLMANTLIVLVLLAGGFGFRYLGQLDFETSFPFAIVTALSLGYGNSTMPTATSRVFLMVYFVMAACAFAAFFYGQHQMILESHEANLIKKIRDRRLRRERTLERFNSLAFQSATANEPQVEERNPNSEGNDHAGSLLSFIAFIRVFGLYFGFLRPTASEQAAIEARAARTARKRRRWEKAREEIRRRRQQSRLAMSAGRIGAVGSALRMRLFGASAGRERVDGGGGSGEDSDVGDDVVASDAVVEVLARGQIDLEAGMGRLAGRNGSPIVQSEFGGTTRSEGCNPASTGAITMSAVLPRPRAPMRGMTEASGQSLGVTEGMMEDELARIIEKQRVRLFVLAVSALWLVSAWVFQWTEPTWTYFDAFYFCFTTMATIGYSDLYPTTAYGWEVWFVFVMTSVGMYASLFGIVGEIWARKYDLAMVRHQARTHERRNRAKLGPGGEQSSERD